MPRITRWFLKSGLMYLLLALVIEILVTFPASGPVGTIAAGMRPLAFHFFFVGWVAQLIMGVSHWFFPRYRREAPRGKSALIWGAFGCLNAGLILRFFSEPAFWISVYPGRIWVAWISAGLQWMGFLLYTFHIWPRIRGK